MRARLVTVLLAAGLLALLFFSSWLGGSAWAGGLLGERAARDGAAVEGHPLESVARSPSSRTRSFYLLPAGTWLLDGGSPAPPTVRPCR